VLRKAFLGKTTESNWWEEEEEREQHLSKQWNEKPHMATLIAGFDDGPVLVSLDQNAAFVAGKSFLADSIGETHWSNAILRDLYKGKANNHSIDKAVRVGLFCAYMASRTTPFTGDSFDVAVVTAENVKLWTEDAVAAVLATLEQTFGEWKQLVFSNSEAPNP